MGCADEMGQDFGDFLPGKHDGYPARLLGMFALCQLWERLFEDVPREEEQRLQRDLVRGSRSLSLDGQMDQQGTDVWSAHARRMARGVEEEKALGPLSRRLFRADAQVCEASDMAHGVEQGCF